MHVEEALDAVQANVSLNRPVGSEDDGELGDLFGDEAAVSPEDEAVDSVRRHEVRRAIEALPERERRIIELRFGIGGDPQALEAIGKELGITRERVRQLEADRPGEAPGRAGRSRLSGRPYHFDRRPRRLV